MQACRKSDSSHRGARSLRCEPGAPAGVGAALPIPSPDAFTRWAASLLRQRPASSTRDAAAPRRRAGRSRSGGVSGSLRGGADRAVTWPAKVGARGARRRLRGLRRREYSRRSIGSSQRRQSRWCWPTPEHFSTNVLRGRLLGLARGWGRGLGPVAPLACLRGERHELGLMAFGLALRSHGWRIAFFGSDTPLHTVEEAADAVHPSLVVLYGHARPHRRGTAAATDARGPLSRRRRRSGRGRPRLVGSRARPCGRPGR